MCTGSLYATGCLSFLFSTAEVIGVCSHIQHSEQFRNCSIRPRLSLLENEEKDKMNGVCCIRLTTVRSEGFSIDR